MDRISARVGLIAALSLATLSSGFAQRTPSCPQNRAIYRSGSVELQFKPRPSPASGIFFTFRDTTTGTEGEGESAMMNGFTAFNLTVSVEACPRPRNADAACRELDQTVPLYWLDADLNRTMARDPAEQSEQARAYLLTPGLASALHYAFRDVIIDGKAPFQIPAHDLWRLTGCGPAG